MPTPRKENVTHADVMLFPKVHFINAVSASVLMHCNLCATLPLSEHQIPKGN
jgi:hypothetical protein